MGAHMTNVWSILYLLSTTIVAFNLNLTAISAKNGLSVLECWQLKEPFVISTAPGFAGSAAAQLGNVQNFTFSIFPAQYAGGPLHNAPRNQYVVYTSGLAHVTVPSDNSTGALISGGEFGLIFAGDTADISKQGHHTDYPGLTETVALQIPTKGNKVPDHKVLYAGPCNVGETAGIRSLATGG